MAETENVTNELIDFGDLCRNGMDDMQYSYYSYNILAFIERKLRFFCKCTRIMTIMENNYSYLQCATIQGRVRTTEAALFFKEARTR